MSVSSETSHHVLAFLANVARCLALLLTQKGNEVQRFMAFDIVQVELRAVRKDSRKRIITQAVNCRGRRVRVNRRACFTGGKKMKKVLGTLAVMVLALT
jgi:hypothetical protein